MKDHKNPEFFQSLPASANECIDETLCGCFSAPISVSTSNWVLWHAAVYVPLLGEVSAIWDGVKRIFCYLTTMLFLALQQQMGQKIPVADEIAHEVSEVEDEESDDDDEEKF